MSKSKSQENFFKIKNKVYYIEYVVCLDEIHIRLFGINPKYRGLGYSYRIFDGLIKKYNKRLTLECWPTLFEYYTKLGFIKTEEDYDGYYVMTKNL